MSRQPYHDVADLAAALSPWSTGVALTEHTLFNTIINTHLLTTRTFGRFMLPEHSLKTHKSEYLDFFENKDMHWLKQLDVKLAYGEYPEDLFVELEARIERQDEMVTSMRSTYCHGKKQKNVRWAKDVKEPKPGKVRRRLLVGTLKTRDEWRWFIRSQVRAHNRGLRWAILPKMNRVFKQKWEMLPERTRRTLRLFGTRRGIKTNVITPPTAKYYSYKKKKAIKSADPVNDEIWGLYPIVKNIFPRSMYFTKMQSPTSTVCMSSTAELEAELEAATVCSHGSCQPSAKYNMSNYPVKDLQTKILSAFTNMSFEVYFKKQHKLIVGS